MIDLGMTHKKVTSIELIVTAVFCAAAAACIPAGSLIRTVIAVSVVFGIICGGYWVWDQEQAMKAAPG